MFRIHSLESITCCCANFYNHNTKSFEMRTMTLYLNLNKKLLVFTTKTVFLTSLQNEKIYEMPCACVGRMCMHIYKHAQWDLLKCTFSRMCVYSFIYNLIFKVLFLDVLNY